jgi:hypothetical protein
MLHFLFCRVMHGITFLMQYTYLKDLQRLTAKTNYKLQLANFTIFCEEAELNRVLHMQIKTSKPSKKWSS